MTPLPVAPTMPAPGGPARPAAASAAAPAPQPLAAPAMLVRVEWVGAVRPPEALPRVWRPEHYARADPDLPTGPPPAFAANLLDRLPDSLEAVRRAISAPPPPATGPVASAAADAPLRTHGSASAPDRVPAAPGGGYAAAAVAAPPRLDSRA